MSTVPVPSERATAKGLWLIGADGELLEQYRSERSAQRAADDFNATGRAARPSRIGACHACQGNGCGPYWTGTCGDCRGTGKSRR